MKTSLEELLEGIAADAAAVEPRSGARPPPPPIPAAALDSLDDGPVLIGPLVPAALPRTARRGPPPPPPKRNARGTEPAATEHSGLIDMRAIAQSYLAEQAVRATRAAEPAAPPAEAAPPVEPVPPSTPLVAPSAPPVAPSAPPVAPSAPAAESAAPPAPPPIVAEGTGPVAQIDPEPATKTEPAAEAQVQGERRPAAWPRIAGMIAAVIVLFAGTVAVTSMIVRGSSDDQPPGDEVVDQVADQAADQAADQVAALPAIANEAPPPPVATLPVPEPAAAVEPVIEAEAAAVDEVSPPPAPAAAVEQPARTRDPAPLPPTMFESENGCFEPACTTTAAAGAGEPARARAKKQEPEQPTYYREAMATRPSSSEIASAVVAVQDLLDGCGDAFGTRGAVQLRMRIAPDGTIGSVAVKQGTASFRSCVSSAVRRAKLAPTELGTTASFSILIR